MDSQWASVKAELEALYSASERLEALFPDRSFALDGHLVGSIGEVVAAYMFDLSLSKASTKGHDAIASDGQKVEIKLTQGSRVAIRHEPEHLIVLSRPKGGPLRVEYNGCGAIAWEAAGEMQSNGQRSITLNKLRQLASNAPVESQMPVVRVAPI